MYIRRSYRNGCEIFAKQKMTHFDLYRSQILFYIYIGYTKSFYELYSIFFNHTIKNIAIGTIPHTLTTLYRLTLFNVLTFKITV